MTMTKTPQFTFCSEELPQDCSHVIHFFFFCIFVFFIIVEVSQLDKLHVKISSCLLFRGLRVYFKNVFF